MSPLKCPLRGPIASRFATFRVGSRRLITASNGAAVGRFAMELKAQDLTLTIAQKTRPRVVLFRV